ncbi:MAG TPA: DinB family protein [Candidatus Binatia bacterium]|jgi:uncharacterized damage-inducible protein DinB|nr:DinB family protein [Candidatus Binatia bacterium]
MSERFLERLFEHNNWANAKIVEACAALSDEQLDAEPRSATKGSIRATLLHLVASQQGYLSLLTSTANDRLDARPSYDQLQEVARRSGEELLALARGESSRSLQEQLQTRDGYFVEPWVVMVQVINHATEHREQINSMLSALGVTPLELDGWSYGEAAGALVPASGSEP